MTPLHKDISRHSLKGFTDKYTTSHHSLIASPGKYMFSTTLLGSPDKYTLLTTLFLENFTGQVDFNLPQRFDITYVDSNTEERRPIMIHRAVLGSFERFFGVLIEHYAGDFPLWLSPTQARVLPVTDAQTSEILEPEVVLQRKECSRSREERSRRGVLRNVSEECREMRVRGMRRRAEERNEN
ncbi:hypothetical protein VIGAN_11139900 [Vigna angularis var. angularis]|uniref:Threonyl-tRNA synthetase n=1 Tax=Vigna angularis var. angularis TaxID=157739 RepID=A0A0S3T9U6_PHAAN|nr:hypothetical protein VIGAN_11139900 [Vigna angularis var. angularis]